MHLTDEEIVVMLAKLSHGCAVTITVLHTWFMGHWPDLDRSYHLAVMIKEVVGTQTIITLTGFLNDFNERIFCTNVHLVSCVQQRRSHPFWRNKYNSGKMETQKVQWLKLFLIHIKSSHGQDSAKNAWSWNLMWRKLCYENCCWKWLQGHSLALQINPV